MKKYIALIFTALFLIFTHFGAFAQTPSTFAIPNGSFENWDSHSGYSVTVLFFPVSVYDSYSTPSQWDYLTYPVNESVSGVTINTQLPLLRVSRETSNVPAGSSALKLQSFMLSDILSSTFYNMAESSIDEALTTTVFPTILSTGVINLDNFLPLMDSLVGSMSDMGQLMQLLNGKDMNNYVNGGVALNGFVPSQITGSYKYTSAVGGDNGAVLLIGTKYNTSTLRREVVGGGFVSLTDASSYTTFSADYNSLHEIDSSYSYIEADSLIIMLISSANGDRQQGSSLYLDALSLVHIDAPADTCGAVLNLTLTAVDTASAHLSWQAAGTPDHFDIEYGPQGFALGTGTTLTSTVNSITISNLQPDTPYDVYVRCACSNELFGSWSQLAFRTDSVASVNPPADTCSAVFNLTLTAVDTTTAQLSWQYTGTPDHFEIEYGPQGFALGNGTTLTSTVNNVTISNLQPDTPYDVYVRSACSDELFGSWSQLTFRTDSVTEVGIRELSSHISVFPNPAEGSCWVVSDQQVPSKVELYSMEGKLLWSVTPSTTKTEIQLPNAGMFIIKLEYPSGNIYRKVMRK